MGSLLDRRQFTGLALAAYAAVKMPSVLRAGSLGFQLATVPPDLPLVKLPPSSETWIQHSAILQPWGATEYKALTELPGLPGQLRDEFGFNALIVLPTEAHNALTDAALPLTDPAMRLTDSQFRDGLEAYREQNYKIILYSSVMHCGHARAWQSGQIAREHPDWLQRDAFGETVGAFGQAWLCPSSPARSYTLAYTLKLVRDYSPDGIMLDNNGFGHTAKGFTCYCEYCQRAFRTYVIARCGPAWVRRELRMRPEEIRIPTARGALLALWLCWRSRIWAETNELFRSRLRQLRSNIVFFVNIQYDENPDPQGSRLQFSREDLVFSETHESDSWYISQKLVLGQALTGGQRPLWNYLATFQDSNPLRLRSVAEVSLMISSSLAHRSLPWINYPGLDSAQDRQARNEIARYVSWFRSNPQLFVGKLISPVGAVVSLLTRDVFEGIDSCSRQGVTGCSPSADTPALIPRHIGLLLRTGMPVVALRETEISPGALRDLRVVTLATAKILDPEHASALASWVRAGGILIAVSDAGMYDELGRKRAGSNMWQALNIGEAPMESQRIGLGRLQIFPSERFDEAVLDSVRSAQLPFTVSQGIEVTCGETSDRYLLHIVLHEKTSERVSLRLPWWLAVRAGIHNWHSPDWDKPRELDFHPGQSMDISGLPTYSVIAMNR